MGIAKQAFKKIAISVAALGLAYGALLPASLIAYDTSPKIRSQTQLESMLEQEKKKLGCNKIIRAELFGSPIPHSTRNRDGTYEIKLNGSLASESVLRHELYHICDGHVDSGYSFLKYNFWHEPQAIIYETTGLEL